MKKIIIALVILIPLSIFLYQEFTPTLKDFPKEEIELGNQKLKVAVAEDRKLQRRGLKGVKDLKELDGMLFVYSKPVTHSFTMKNTLIPLRIGFYSSQGELVDKKKMTPCEKDCKSYKSSKKYKYALEVPQASDIKLNLKLKP